MGVTQTGEIFKGFIFDGIDSKGYGVYITGSGVYNAPERDVETFEIHGRNGAYILDNGRFRNISVTYPAGMFGNDGGDFAEGISKLRNALASRRGYCKLVDEYNPLEYRMAMYKGGLDVEPTAINGDNKAGKFSIVFECKPQRFLIQGDEPVAVASGENIFNPTHFESHPLLMVKGYGSASINGEDVVLHNEPLGRVQLGGGTSYVYSVSYQFDQSRFNTGDIITVPAYGKSFQIDMNKPYGSGQIREFQMTSMTATDYIFASTNYQGTFTVFTDISTFSVGTARTDSYQVVGKIKYINSGGTASEADFTAGTRVVYNGNGAVSFTAYWYAEDTDFHKTAVYDNAPNFYGDSTWQPVTDTAYIDLDIGEAYVVQNDNVIGINNVVDLPAELPTLKAGANTLTYDNTITKLEIVPRWWRV